MVTDSKKDVKIATVVHTSTVVYSVESSKHDSKKMTNIYIIESAELDSREESVINM